MRDVQKVPSSTPLLESCRLKPVASFKQLVHLASGLPLLLLPPPHPHFPSIVPFPSRSWEGPGSLSKASEPQTHHVCLQPGIGFDLIEQDPQVEPWRAAGEGGEVGKRSAGRVGEARQGSLSTSRPAALPSAQSGSPARWGRWRQPGRTLGVPRLQALEEEGGGGGGCRR